MASDFDPLAVKAMVFDTFGTVVDWRGSIIAEGESYWKPAKGVDIDWAAFADAWRGKYGPSMNKVRTGEIPWTKLDELHRMALDQNLAEFNVTGLSEADKQHLNFVWHRLNAWPDAAAGLARLKSRYLIAPLSNGNLSLLTEMAKFAGLPWDCVLGADLFQHYKPDPETLPWRRRDPRARAGAGDDDGGARQRPQRGARARAAHRLRPPRRMRAAPAVSAPARRTATSTSWRTTSGTWRRSWGCDVLSSRCQRWWIMTV